MNHAECIKAIKEKLDEIVGIYHQYNPDGKYLSLTYSDGWQMVNNRYWEEDKNRAIRFAEEEGEILDESEL